MRKIPKFFEILGSKIEGKVNCEHYFKVNGTGSNNVDEQTEGEL